MNIFGLRMLLAWELLMDQVWFLSGFFKGFLSLKARLWTKLNYGLNCLKVCTTMFILFIICLRYLILSFITSVFLLIKMFFFEKKNKLA